MSVHGTYPDDDDTDDDGFSDGEEVAAGTDPTDYKSNPAAQVPSLPLMGLLLLAGILASIGVLRMRPRDP